MRVILGSPVAPGRVAGQFQWLPCESWQYCEGDDLSENAYRISQELYMRWGYINESIEPVQFPVPANLRHFTDAHTVAITCCNSCYWRNNQNAISGQNFLPYEVIFVQ
jgi:hypothetical protein